MAAPNNGTYPFNGSHVAPIQYSSQPVFYYANQQQQHMPQQLGQVQMQQMQLQQPSFHPVQMMGHTMGAPYLSHGAGPLEVFAPSAEQQKQQLAAAAAAKAAKADAMFGDIVVGMGLSKAAPTPSISQAEPLPSMNMPAGAQFAAPISGAMPHQHAPQGYATHGMPVQYFMVQQPNGAMYMMPMQATPAPMPTMPLAMGTVAAPMAMASVQSLPADADEFSDFAASAPAPQSVAPPKMSSNPGESGAHMLDSMFGGGGSAALLPAAKPTASPSPAANIIGKPAHVATESAVRVGEVAIVRPRKNSWSSLTSICASAFSDPN
jgi:hypothetical protein